MAYQSNITPQQAVALGLEFLEVALTNWGNNDLATADVESLVFPLPISDQKGFVGGSGLELPSVTGIAISPDSTVDRVIVRQNIPAPMPGFRAGIDTREIEIAVGRPFLGLLPGKLFLIAATPTRFHSEIRPDIASDPTVTAPFGINLRNNPPVGVTDPFVWNDPMLRVLLFLRERPSVSTSRRPYAATFGSETISPLGVDTIRHYIPISGRKRVRVTIRILNAGAGTATVRLTGVAQGGTQQGLLVGGAPSGGAGIEFPLTGPVTIDGTVGPFVASLVADNPECIFLGIRATWTGGLAPGIVTYVQADD